MIWNGTDPLQPDHEVAYRWWPTERVRIIKADLQEKYHSVLVVNLLEDYTTHTPDGRYLNASIEYPLDLIPLQQEPHNGL